MAGSCWARWTLLACVLGCDVGMEGQGQGAVMTAGGGGAPAAGAGGGIAPPALDAGERPQAIDAATSSPGQAGTGGGIAGSAASPGVDGGAPDGGLSDGPTVTGAAGKSHALTIDGHPVTVHVPSFVENAPAAPVVFSLHGLSIPSAAMTDITGLPALADQKGFIAVFPEGVGGTWNTGGSACGLGAFAGNTSDDHTYLLHVLDAVDMLHPVDRDRVFVSGFSMGGYASNALACNHPETFRAAAPASGGAPPGPCATAVLPVMIFHGTADATIAHDCGVQARKAWAEHNGCSTDVDSVAVMGGTCEWSRGCPQDGQVVFCSFPGMPHGWAGSTNPFALGGAQFESATALMWKFFEDRL